MFAVFGGAVIGTLWFALALLWHGLFGRRAPAADATKESAPPIPPDPAPAGSGPRTPVEPSQTGPVAFGVHVPFGPMLAAGGLLYFLVVHRWVDAYFAGIAGLL